MVYPGSFVIFFMFGLLGFLIVISIVRAARRFKRQWHSIDYIENRQLYRVAGPPDNDWLCANPKCFAKNPGHARYCRMCARPGPRCDPFN